MTTPVLLFRQSTRCSKGGCIQSAPLADGGVIVRSTLQPERVLTLTPGMWAGLLATVKGEHAP